MFDDFDTQIQCEEFYADFWQQYETELREQFELENINDELQMLYNKDQEWSQ